ncbi:cytospin-A [Drosophila santomea]|uniref:cytospin-A n=1 Tax=Drosophila santomea TaxID=129105 RepID=UPI001954BDC8|nr:cytospin-A [Drosophila santomea]
MCSLLKELVSQIKEIQSDLKDDTHLGPDRADWSRNEVRRMKNCLGRVILFTRSLRETFAESPGSGDQDPASKATVLLRCTRYIKRLSTILPLLEAEESLNKVNKTLFQLDVDTILFELECIVKEALKPPSAPQFAYPEPCCTTAETCVKQSSICELNKLRLMLRTAEKKKELEVMGHNLMIMKEKTLVLQARRKQEVAEHRLAEEQDRNKALEECLTKCQIHLKDITEQYQKLKEASKQLIKERNQIRPQKRCPQSWNAQVVRRKSRISTRKSLVWESVKLNQSEQETLMKLKTRLSEEKDIRVRAKTAMCKIKKDMDALYFGKALLRLGLQKESKSGTNAIRSLRKNSKDTLVVIDKALSALSHYNRLKFPYCRFKLSRLMECLYDNMMTIRKRWIRKISSAVEPKLSGSESRTLFLPKPPMAVSYSPPELFWDKIYKPCTQSKPITSNASLIPVLPKKQYKPLSLVPLVPRKVPTRVPCTASVPKYLGKTFGDRRLSLLRWCRERVKPYGIPMYEFSASWSSGRALCAIIHSYRPDLVDKTYLGHRRTEEALAYGIQVAKSLGVSESVDLIGELRQGHPNLEKVVGFVEELQSLLEPGV